MPPITTEKVMNDCNIKSALDAGRALGSPFNVIGENSVAVLPAGYQAVALEPLIEKYAAAPKRLKATVGVTTVESLIRYVTDFKGPRTRVFIQAPPSERPRVVAIMDYHTVGNPSWLDHKAVYEPQFTPEWTRWLAGNKKRMSQLDLAEFLEENQLLVINPPGAELLELVQTLEGKNDIRCNSSIRLNNGRTKLLYEEDVELKGSLTTKPGEIEFPSDLIVGLPPFQGGPTYKLRCRLKYRIESRRLSFWFEAVDLHLILNDAVNDLVNALKTGLGLDPIFGGAI